VNYLLHRIVHGLSVYIVPYSIRPSDKKTLIFDFSWVDFYRVDFELSGDTMFDMIGPKFL